MNFIERFSRIDTQERARILIVEKYPGLGLLGLFSLALGFWLGSPPELKYTRELLVEISTLIPLFVMVVGVSFECIGGFLMFTLAEGIKRWNEVWAEIKAVKRAEQERISKLKKQAYEEGKAEGLREARQAISQKTE